MDTPAIHLVKANHVDDSSPLMLEAVENYLRIKGNDDRTFVRAAKRNGEYVVKALGNRPITSYVNSEAAEFRDWCLGKGMSITSVKRVFASVRSIINLNIREYGLDGLNAFAGTYMPYQSDAPKRQSIPIDILKVIQKRCQSTDDNAFARTYMPDDDSQRRLPIPIDCIRAIQSDCHDIDDDMRWLLALLSDTGMRLGEAVGLALTDLKLSDEIPHINITPHSWRRLKTKESERCIPLVGEALWAASRAIEDASGSSFLFPRYNRGSSSNANPASAAINKWLKPRVPEGCVIHSFKHSMPDRLCAVECPSDIIDAIGGWQTNGVGQRYGTGQPLEVKAKWVRTIDLC